VIVHCLGVLIFGALLSAQNTSAVDVRPLLDRAEQAAQRGDMQGAIRELQEAIRLSPNEAEAHGRLGIVLRKLGRLKEAGQSLKRAIELRPDSRLNVLLAFTYMELGDCGNAVPLLSASFDAEQNESIKVISGQRLVECSLALGKPEQALPHVQKLREIAAHDPNVLYLSSKVYMSLWNEAFQLMLIKAPASHQVRLIQAEALEAQERFEEAAHEYRAVLQIAPRLGDMHYRLGRAILRSRGEGKSDVQAQSEFRKELEINPLHLGAITEIAEVHLRNGELNEASHRFTEALRLQPGLVPARVGLAKVLIAEKQWSGALEHLEIAAKAAPQNEAVQYQLMLAYRGLGRAAEAKQASEAFERLKQEKKQNGSTPKVPQQ
jgi:tetratricopeptide (TPR) repeat protein